MKIVLPLSLSFFGAQALDEYGHNEVAIAMNASSC
jgi:hypothetical protein